MAKRQSAMQPFQHWLQSCSTEENAVGEMARSHIDLWLAKKFTMLMQQYNGTVSVYRIMSEFTRLRMWRAKEVSLAQCV